MELPPNSLFLFSAAIGAAALAAIILRTIGHGRGHRIRVVGVGGGGANAVGAMIRAGLRGVDYVVVDTDARALQRSSGTRVAIGRQITNGIGTGGDPGAGEVSARDATDQIGRALAGSDFVVITAGLGGGAGSGAAPVVAEIARQKGALTMAVVTTPFGFEGRTRHQLAEQAAATLAGKVDAVATVPNDQVRELMPATATIEDAFQTIDATLSRTVGEILDLVAVRGRMDLDFADVRAVLQRGGAAAVGIGRASGENRAAEAAGNAIAAALPGCGKAGSVLVNLSGSKKLRLAEVDAVADAVQATAGPDANLVFGVSLRPRLRDNVQVTVIATGLEQPKSVQTAQPAPGKAEASASAATSSNPAVSDPSNQAWRPVWLRRADAHRAAPAPRPRRKGSARSSVNTPSTSETSSTD